MTTLFPRGYGGNPSYQFNSPNQFNTGYYYGRYPRQGPSFAPHYPTHRLYQPPFNNGDRYGPPIINQYRNPGIGTQLANLFNELDEQYRYEGYLRQLEKLRKQQARQQPSTLPLTMYPTLQALPAPGVRPPVFLPQQAPLPPPPQNYPFNTIYQLEKVTRYLPYPIYIGPGGVPLGTSGNLGNMIGSNLNYGTGGGMSLPPKVRVIFIPTGQSYYQQPYTGSLAMPPFLYNRISQPFCSFPLPPPLPQVGSLPLTPAIQQMVMQRYSNPVAVLPFNSNWQMPPMMIPGYSMASQPQQLSLPPAPQAYIPAPALPSAPISAVPQYPLAPQAYIPPPAPQVYMPPPPPVPQTYIPPPAPQIYIPPSAPQTYIPPSAPQTYIPPPPPPVPQTYVPSAAPFPTPISAFQSLQSTQQAYIPPPSMQLPLPDASTISSSLEHSYGGYPSTCRACPPAPPPLNITVTGHCWVQHCCACHHVPTPSSNPNVRPGGGRITPLLRQPTVPQYIPEQISQQQQQKYFHSNAPVMMRPWLRKTPPLPPGAVVISDEYIGNSSGHSRYSYPERQHRQHKRSSHDKRRSATVSSKTTSSTSQAGSKNTRSVSTEKPSVIPVQTNKNHINVTPTKTISNNNNSIPQQGPIKSNSAISTCTTSTSTSDLSAEYNKTVLQSPVTRQNAIPPPLNAASRNVNLQYRYQPQELSSVYLLNRYLKSSSEGSTLSSNNVSRSNDSSPFVNEHRTISSPSSDSSSIKQELNFEKEDENSRRPPSQPTKSKEKLVIIREFRTNSPSTLSTVSSDLEFSVINKDEDTISTTSTIKANKLEEKNVLHRQIF